jgi:hypothetical protein
MKVTDTTTGQQVSSDEAYERFFDGFFNLGRPSDILERSVVLSRPAMRPAAPRRSTRRMKRGSPKSSRAFQR